MAAVGGGVNQHVFRAGLHAPFDHRLQELVLHLVFLKGKVVDENQEAVIPVLDLPQQGRQFPELVLVDLNHPQALVVILVDQGLDAGGFSRPRVAVEQHVVGVLPGQERLRIPAQLRLLALIAQKILQPHAVHIADGQKLQPILPPDAEGPVPWRRRRSRTAL